MKVIIAGSREFSDFNLLREKCEEIISSEEVEIVSGTAKGADKMGEEYAKAKGYQIKRFPANWNKYGKSAGYLRNKEMAEYADSAIIFWDGSSKGTKHMIDLAKDKGLKVNIILYKDLLS